MLSIMACKRFSCAQIPTRFVLKSSVPVVEQYITKLDRTLYGAVHQNSVRLTSTTTDRTSQSFSGLTCCGAVHSQEVCRSGTSILWSAACWRQCLLELYRLSLLSGDASVRLDQVVDCPNDTQIWYDWCAGDPIQRCALEEKGDYGWNLQESTHQFNPQAIEDSDSCSSPHSRRTKCTSSPRSTSTSPKFPSLQC